MNADVRFISYNGRYPNLCRGTLVIEVNGKQYSLLYALASGGAAYFTNNYSEEHVEEGKWSVSENALPEGIRQYKNQIEEVVNDCVPHGCCGGCL